MQIEINPRSLLNLENICEVLYKLHPSVLDYLVDMERTLGSILGFNEPKNLSLEKRELLNNLLVYDCEYDSEYDSEYNNPEYDDSEYDELFKYPEIPKDSNYERLKNIDRFKELLKYLKLDTYEYIPIKIYIEVEDPVIGKKVRELVRALEKTGAPEQFYLNKRELDYHAYFAEGYNIISMNEEQKKKKDDLFSNDNVEGLKKNFNKGKVISLNLNLKQ